MINKCKVKFEDKFSLLFNARLIDLFIDIYVAKSMDSIRV
jgi:hypothetical protein